MELSVAQEAALDAAVDRALDYFACGILNTVRIQGEHLGPGDVREHCREAGAMILDAIRALLDGTADEDGDGGPDWSLPDLSLEPRHAATIRAVNALSPG